MTNVCRLSTTDACIKLVYCTRGSADRWCVVLLSLFHRNGLDKYGFNRDGFDRDGYDVAGYDK